MSDIMKELEELSEDITPDKKAVIAGDATFNESLDLIKKAMKDVVQEMIINLGDGTSHIIYVHKISYLNGEISVDFSTLSDERKDELWPHVEACVRAQIASVPDPFNRRKKILSF